MTEKSLNNIHFGISNKKKITEQPYQVALLIAYKEHNNYCAIKFIQKPDQVQINHSMYHDSVILKYNRPIEDRDIFICSSPESNNSYLGIVGINPLTGSLEAAILRINHTEYSTDLLDRSVEYHCQMIVPETDSVINRLKAAYKRNYLTDYQQLLFEPLCRCKELPEITFNKDASNFNSTSKIANSLMEKLKYIANQSIGANTMFGTIPVITRVIINNPGVVVFWSDGTKTVGKCMDKDEFNPEIGLSMAISRKYYELLGFPNPRSAFKNQLKNAEYQSQKTADKRSKKMKLLEEKTGQ